MGKKNITFNDIAKYTGFSKTTVSRYFNNPDSVTLENQDKISQALKDLNRTLDLLDDDDDVQYVYTNLDE